MARQGFISLLSGMMVSRDKDPTLVPPASGAQVPPFNFYFNANGGTASERCGGQRTTPSPA
jgi:hypothetical protein